jgi:hypothetical protein
MAKSATKRATVYFENNLHKTLRLKAIELERSFSDLVNEAVRQSLGEDAEDLAAIRDRVCEKSIPFEEALKQLKASGRI